MKTQLLVVVRWLALPVLALLLHLAAGITTQAAAVDLFISEYIEGTSNNKAIEIYNGTGAAVDLGGDGYQLQMYFNGNPSAGLTINLTGVVAPGDVHVVAHSSAVAAILAQADQTNGAGWFNGDDAVVLRKGGAGGSVLDVIGQIGFDPGTEWGAGLTSTADNTLRRKQTICAGDTDGGDPFDPSVEWDGFATDTFDGLGSHIAACDVDNPPTVTGTAPPDSAVGVAIDANLVINFSEPVTVSDGWFAIACTLSGPHTATTSGGPQSFTLDPDLDFNLGESCTVTVQATNVVDQDGTPDLMPADFVWSFQVEVLLGACFDGTETRIHTIQGDSASSPLVGKVAVIQGVVTGDFQDTVTELRGFYVQEEDAETDADPLTSEGLFVFDSGFPVDVTAGDAVRVRGTVTEFGAGRTLTELAGVSDVVVCGTGATVTPVPVTLPVADLAYFERLEGMLVTFPQELFVTEHFNLGRFGEVHLAASGRLVQPTQVAAPGGPAQALQALNDRSRIILDDANLQQNRDPIIYPPPGLSADNTLRLGDSVSGLTGILDDRFDAYRVQPTALVTFTPLNTRPAAPDPVGGTLKVASFNVLNYFTAFGNSCGPTGNMECRGASDPDELQRQRAKVLSALLAIDADLVGLIELENNPSAAIQDLVVGLNDALGDGTYAFIDTGAIGTDAIKVGLIYKSGRVSPAGAHAILDTSVDPRFIDTKNRPVLAQTFVENASGERFTVAVNHLKSKGSGCNDVGDPDVGDGQGNCNGTRTAAAVALADWLAGDPTGSNDPDFLIIGDLNSYALEDPITAIVERGYTNLISVFSGATAYSYVFEGQLGYLDHALASASLTPRVIGVTEWHINADEPRVLDYTFDFKSAGQIVSLYSPDPYRSSDHDPLVVGLCLDVTPPALSVNVTPNVLWPPNHKYVTVNVTVDTGEPATVTLLDVTSNEPDNGTGDGDTPNDIVINSATQFNLRAERAGDGQGRIYTITYTAEDACGNRTEASAQVVVPVNQGSVVATALVADASAESSTLNLRLFLPFVAGANR